MSDSRDVATGTTDDGSEEPAGPPVERVADQRAAVVRLTEALAAAQAVARESAALDDPEPTDRDPGDPEASADDTLRAGIDALEYLDGSPPVRTEPPDPVRRTETPDVVAATSATAAIDAESTGRITAVGTDSADAEPADAESADELTPARNRGARGRPRRLWPLNVVMALLVLAVPALAWVGYRLASDSTAGEVLGGKGNPSEPGYTALVEPTPAALVMLVSDDGHAQGLAILSLSGPDQEGGVVMVAPVDVHLSEPRLGITTFAGIIDVNSPETGGWVIGDELGLGFTEVIELTSSQLTTLIEPVAPLVIENPEAVTRLDGEVIEEGTIKLEADEVSDYLIAEDVGHTTSGKLARHRLFWEAWVDAVARSDATTAIPGERNTGIGRYLGGLSAGEVQSASVPVTVSTDDDGETVLAIDHDPTMLLIANAVPFPVAALPDGRATVALLNGTGPESVPGAVIQRLTYAGAQITTLGNAKSFDQAETTLTYTNPKFRSFAEEMAEALGVGRVVESDAADESVDVAVILGQDLMGDPPSAMTIEEIETS